MRLSVVIASSCCALAAVAQTTGDAEQDAPPVPASADTSAPEVIPASVTEAPISEVAAALAALPSFSAEATPATAPSPTTQPQAPPTATAQPRPPSRIGFGEPRGLSAFVSGNLRASFLGMQPFPTDVDNTPLSAAPLETRIRVVPQIRYWNLALVGEVDLATGALTGLPNPSLRLGQSAHPLVTPAELRQLFLEYKGERFVVRAGQQTQSWGLGLVANDGADDAEPGEFGAAHYGDLAWRAMIAGRPLYGLGGAWRSVEPILAADLIVRDETADYAQGDRAAQAVLAVRLNQDPNHQVGVYTAYRHERLTAAGSIDGARTTDSLVLDFAGSWQWVDEKSGAETKLAFEVAWKGGKTALARSETTPELSLGQFGAVGTASVRNDDWETYLDVGYASGDQNPYDDRLEGFRFNPDYHAGVVLYQEVLGWQTARTYARVTDPSATGLPPEGANLLPTRGAITGSSYAFPRLRKGFSNWLDIYGGPLFAVTTASLVDAFNSRVAGGMPRNSLGGSPGRYLGTEFDLGIQARLKPVRGMSLTVTGEGGYLVPGSAFSYENGDTMQPVAAANLRVGMSF